MKRFLLYSFAILLVFVLSLLLLFRFETIKAPVFKWIEETIEEQSGWKVHVEKVEGFLPFQAKILGLQVEAENKALFKIDELALTIYPWDLLRGDLTLGYIYLKGVDLKSAALPFLPQTTNTDSPWIKRVLIHYFLLESEQTDFKLEGSSVYDLKEQSTAITLEAQEGAFYETLSLQWQNQAPYHGRFTLTVPHHKAEGELSGKFCLQDGLWMLEETSFYLKSAITGPIAINGKGVLDLFNHRFTGDFIGKNGIKGDLSIHHQNGNLHGMLEADFSPYTTLSLEVKTQSKGVDIWLNTSKINYGEWSVEQATLALNLNDYLNPCNGSLRIDASEILKGGFKWDHLTFNTPINLEQTGWPFELRIIGGWLKDTDLYSNGHWRATREGVFGEVDTLKGRLFDHQIGLVDPFVFSYANEKAMISHGELRIDEGQIGINGTYSHNEISGQAHLDQIPLSFINPWLGEEWDAEGDIHAFANINGPLSKPSGKLALDLLNLKIHHPSLNHFPPLRFHTEATLKNHRLQGLCFLEEGQERPFSAEGVISLEGLEVDRQGPIDFTLQGHGDAAPIFDCFLNETTILTGNAEVNVSVKGTWSDPIIDGIAQFTEGAFESLSSGAIFNEIEARFHGDGHELVLESFSAHDGERGRLRAEGAITFDSLATDPLKLRLEMERCVLIRQDFAKVAGSGELILTADMKKALLKGTLEVNDASIQIPHRGQGRFKYLDVEYVNGPSPLKAKAQWIANERKLPVLLDLKLHSPAVVSLSGQNLESLWEGDLELSGTSDKPRIFGALNLVNGTYFFNGKPFESRRGNISFAGDPRLKTQMYVIAEQEIEGNKIEAILKGPIYDPLITFRSNPTMTQREILSWILFNHGLEDATPYQSEQIAESAFSINNGASSSGADFLTRLRETVGIDRLDIHSVETDDDNEVSVKVGKYISRGVLVSVSKSITAEANQVALEANLTRHIKVQGEVGDNAQGKMSLKWENDY